MMKMNFLRLIFLIILTTVLVYSCNRQSGSDSSKDTVLYEPTWESLSNHDPAPEWFKDAKLGIYFHWGVYSVPAFGSEWYPRHMHFEDRREYEHHLETYGHPSEFGYHDFVPMFKAENFNAEEWADLFVRAGARFAGPVAEHHDGFSMWDSEVTPWNSMDKGPRRDITGELKEAITGNGMKFITTFHHAKHLQRYSGQEEEQMAIEDNPRARFRNSHYPLFPGMPPTTDDAEWNYLYGNIPEEEWLEKIWLGKLKEVVDNYQPDIVWFDSWLDQIPDTLRRRFCAYYLNAALQWDKEVVIVRKQDDLPLDFSVDDLEKSRKNKLEKKAWMTDETISKGSWCYTEDLEIKASRDVLHVLIDIVSKNGVLLLNISPKSDGTIPEDQKQVLLDIGKWLENFGEAIYETRPWYTFGEGPTKEPEGHFKNHSEFLKVKYSSEDLRYTTRDDVVYASLLGTPAAGEKVTLESFSAVNYGNKIGVVSVELLGSEKEPDWELTDEGLVIEIPDTKLNEMAVVLKITTKG